jgi:TRAP-type mannitol/chloroaromatic compound transport system substrate-binding protein
VAIPSADSGCQMSGWFRREIKSTACRKFRDEQFLWFRVAENTYDNCAFHSKMGERK